MQAKSSDGELAATCEGERDAYDSSEEEEAAAGGGDNESAPEEESEDESDSDDAISVPSNKFSALNVE